MHTIALACALALYHKILYFGLKPQHNNFVFNPATQESARIPDAPTPYGFDHAIFAYGLRSLYQRLQALQGHQRTSCGHVFAKNQRVEIGRGLSL